MVSRTSGRRELEERVRQLEFIIDAIPAFVAYVDAGERYRFNNKRYEDLFGAARGSLYGRRVAEILGDTAYAATWDYILAALSGRAVSFDSPVPSHIGGRERVFRASYVPHIHDNGSVTGFVALVIDDTDRTRAEEALRASEIYLSGILDIAPVAIVSTDDAQRIRVFNKSAEAIFGYSAAEILGEDLGVLLPAPYRVAHREHVATFSQGPPSTRLMGERGEIHGRRKNGDEFPAEGSIAVVEYGGKKSPIVAIRDLSEQRRAESEHRVLQEQFLQAQKLEAVGHLAGGVAHDFNNLLTIIMGCCDFVLDGLAPQDPKRADVTEIKDAAERAAALTRQLLAFSRRQVLQPQVLDLNDLVANIEQMLRRLIGEDIELLTKAASDLGHVRVDRGQIEQVIINLAVNARDAMPRGGTLTFETANAELNETYLGRHFAVQPGTYVVLAVSDTGIGMDVETQARIFEPFFTTKQKGKGAGLGLATVYGIVKQSRGYIWVYSEPGQGTIFKIYLPRVDEPVEVTDASAIPARPPRGSETVLLVEDEEKVRSFVRRALEAHGYAVLEAARPEDALVIGREHQGPIDLLLTDVVMPDMSGRDLAVRIAAMRPQMKILYMSGYAGDAVLRRGIVEARASFLHKPLGVDAVARKVREVLDTPPHD